MMHTGTTTSGFTFVNGKCAVPDEITEYKRWKVYLVGVKDGYRITTNEVEVRQS